MPFNNNNNGYQHHPYGNFNNNNNMNQQYNHNNNGCDEDPTISRIEAGVSHLQNVLTQVNTMSTNAGALGERFVELLDSVDQLRQERDSSQYEISRLRHENLALHNSLRSLLRIIERFSSVEDPVVASDGYTYERRDILKYFEDCKKTNTVARSHLTQEDLVENVIVSNLSMKRMLNLLQEVEIPILGQPYNLVGNNNNNGYQQQQNNNNNNNVIRQPQVTLNEPPTSSVAHQNNNNNRNTNSPSLMNNNNQNGNTNGGSNNIHNNNNLNTSQSSPAFGHQNHSNNNSNSNYNRERRRSSATEGGRSGGGGGSRRQSLQTPVVYSGKLHPCIRVYGRCKFEDECVFAKYPFEVCLSFLKGKCRFGSTCLEPHVEFNGDQTQVHQQGFGMRTDSESGTPQAGNSRRQSVQHQQH